VKLWVFSALLLAGVLLYGCTQPGLQTTSTTTVAPSIHASSVPLTPSVEPTPPRTPDTTIEEPLVTPPNPPEAESNGVPSVPSTVSTSDSPQTELVISPPQPPVVPHASDSENAETQTVARVQIIVAFEAGVTQTQMQDITSTLGAQWVKFISTASQSAVVSVPQGQENAFIKQVELNQDVRYAEIDQVVGIPPSPTPKSSSTPTVSPTPNPTATSTPSASPSEEPPPTAPG
jgi:hypothetical protein